MHQHCFSQDLTSFFQCLAHRLGADTVHYLTLHQPVSQRLQRPAGPSLWRLGAGDCHQSGFAIAVQLSPTPVDLPPAAQGSLPSFR